jgi:heat shock protein HslJ
MKRYLLPISTLILIVAACSFPPILAASTPASVNTPLKSGSQPGLSGTTWMWIGFTSPNEQVAVESPANYSLVFQGDGSLDITADCNTGRGSYQAQGQSIQIQPGSMTKAVCPPGSRSDQLIQYLASAASYSVQDGSLYIDLAADGGTLVFARSEAVTAGNGAVQQALQANPWQWDAFASPAGETDVENPGSYLLTFHEDGTVEIKADCNTAAGTYSIDGIKMSIQVGPVTQPACAAGSRNEEFIRYLGSASVYIYQPGELFINLAGDGGTMRFTPVTGGS